LALPEELLLKSATDLGEMRKITEIDWFLRRNLWIQIGLAHSGKIKEVTPISIYAGVCSKQNFEHAIKNPIRVAWYLSEPQQDMDRLKAGLEIGITRLLEFVERGPMPGEASSFMKAIELLMNRVHGPVKTIIESKHAHLNLNKPIQANTNINERIDQLKSKLLPHQETEKDVTQIDEDNSSGVEQEVS